MYISFTVLLNTYSTAGTAIEASEASKEVRSVYEIKSFARLEELEKEVDTVLVSSSYALLTR